MGIVFAIQVLFGILIVVFAFYQLFFGGEDSPQDSVPPARIGGGHGGLS